MSLSQANIKWISTLSGVSEEEISGALSKENEVTLDLKLSGRVITQADEAELKTTLTDAGIEIGYKKLSKAAGLDLAAGEKDPSKIVEKLTTSITSTLEEKYKNPKPGEREIELEGKLKTEEDKYKTLFETHSNTLKTVEDKDKAYVGLQGEIKTKERNNKILKSLPEKMKISRSDALMITVNSFEFGESDGTQTMTRKEDGKLMVDSLGKPESVDNVIKSFIEQKEWVKGSGMGGGDRGSGTKKGGKTPEEAHKFLNEKGVNPSSPEGIKEFMELTTSKSE
jgi:RNase P/RNase MRP subunit p29